MIKIYRQGFGSVLHYVHFRQMQGTDIQEMNLKNIEVPTSIIVAVP
jgi:hypothetical protein